MDLGTLESTIVSEDGVLAQNNLDDIFAFDLERTTNLQINGIASSSETTSTLEGIVVPAVGVDLILALDNDEDGEIDDGDTVIIDDFVRDRLAFPGLQPPIPPQEIVQLDNLSPGNYLLELAIPESIGTTNPLLFVDYSLELVPTTSSNENSSPLAEDDTYSTNENTTLIINATEGILSNDTDPEADSLTATIIEDVGSGELNFNPNGSFTYTPNDGFVGTDTFTYEVSDGNGGTDTATVELIISEINDNNPPIAEDDNYSTDEDTTLTINAANGVLDNDTDDDGDTLTAIVSDDVNNGTLTLNSNGSFSYTPNANFNGIDSFTYQVSDNNGGTAFASVELTVNRVNNDEVTELEFNQVFSSRNVPARDRDTLTFFGSDEQRLYYDGLGSNTVVSVRLLNPSGNTIFNSMSAALNSSEPIILQEDGTYELILENGSFFPAEYSFKLLDIDSDATEINFNTLVEGSDININPARESDLYSFNSFEAQQVLIDVKDSPESVDFILFDSENQQITPIPDSADLRFQLAENENYLLVAEGESITETPSYSFEIITFENSSPVAVDDTASTDEDTAITFTFNSLLQNDSDLDNDELDITRIIAGNTVGSVDFDRDAGNIVYRPGIGFDFLTDGETATDTFEYTISDGRGGTDNATVTITISGINESPNARDDVYNTDENTSITTNNIEGVLSNDSDPEGDFLTASVVEGVENGNLEFNPEGSFTYTPNDGFVGTDTFTYEVSDGNGGTDTATVELIISEINDNNLPIAEDDNYSTDEDTTLTINAANGVLDNDTDDDGDTLTAIVSDDVDNGTLDFNADGSFSYTPNANFNGIDSFTYRISDGNGGTDTATVDINVDGDNDAPIANDDTATTDEDTPLVIPAATLTANDTDADGDILSITNVFNPVNGTVELDGTEVTFIPDTDFNGDASFEYTVSDGNSGTDTATVSVTINLVNDAPVAVDDTASTLENTPLIIDAIDLLSNDTDVDGDILTIADVDDAVNGEVTIDGTEVSFTPDTDFIGDASFEYTVSDGNSGTDTATVTLRVEEDSLPSIIEGTPGRDSLTGTDEPDRIIGGQGIDNIITGQGADIIVYESIIDAGDIIDDLEIGMDIIDLRGVLESVGFDGVDPIADSYISFMSSGSGTIMMLDADGNGSAVARPYLFVKNITEAALNNSDNFISA